ncbi:MAG: biotin--[acetyl-CoA-carboxylase] ligase [Bacteroidetes bacterium]|nr:biotin--[acetyl-CoA-carboxylase] ligase [Bacteroidota bacterium]MDA0995280.1 biotin--[acetyl-CoA-carboxylase] ligase [Pseudomonadota bacterium]
MRLIKLDAINSTNEYLKDNIQKNLSKETQVAYTFNQTKGKGQRGKVWTSEPEKNIALSIIFYPKNVNVKDQFVLSMQFSLFILNILKSLGTPDLKIKWPNDIMSGKTKVCGILSEIKVKGRFIENIIIGFGINVNQENFTNLPNASSLKLINKIDYDLKGLVFLIFQSLKKYNYLTNAINGFSEDEFFKVNYQYHQNLYRLGEQSDFINDEGFFKGKILEVNKRGMIKIQKDNNSIVNYSFQEIQMVLNN